MRSLAKKCVTAVFAVGLGCSAQSQTLPTVNVVDSWAYGGGFGNGYEFFDGGSGVGVPFAGYPQIVAAIDQMRSLSDVRCSGGAYRNVTSQSDPIERTLAAEQIFRVVQHGRSLWDRYFNKKPYTGGELVVIYADGGSETFVVVNPTFTTALPAGPKPGTLQPGNGQVQPHPICG